MKKELLEINEMVKGDEIAEKTMSDHVKYLQEKRAEVLKKIRPICEAFGIEDYDYIVSDKGETEILRIGTTKIGCSWNSIDAVVQEL